MSQIYFITVCLLVSPLFVLGTPVDDSPSIIPHAPVLSLMPGCRASTIQLMGFDEPTEGRTLRMGTLAFTELGRFAGKTYWIGSTSPAQAAARADCASAGFDLLRFTAGIDEFNFIQTSLTRVGVTTNVWTDYTNFVEHDCFRSHGEVVPHALAITATTNAGYQIGLAISRTGGLNQYSTNSGLRYICK